MKTEIVSFELIQANIKYKEQKLCQFYQWDFKNLFKFGLEEHKKYLQSKIKEFVKKYSSN